MVLREVIFSRQFRTPDGIACRVPVVWVLHLPMYLNCCLFFLYTKNSKSPLEDQIIFISRKVNFSFAIILTLSFSAEGGRSISFVHVYAVNCRWWFPAVFSTVFWNSYNKYLISCTLFFTLKITRMCLPSLPRMTLHLHCGGFCTIVFPPSGEFLNFHKVCILGAVISLLLVEKILCDSPIYQLWLVPDDSLHKSNTTPCLAHRED